MKILFTLLFSGLFLFSFGQKKECDCYKFYTGTFYTEPFNTTDTVIIERDKKYQYEYEVGKKSEQHVLRVIWLNDCKYILRNQNKQPSSTTKILRGDVVVQIIETTKEYYVVKAYAKGNKKMIFKVFVYNPN